MGRHHSLEPWGFVIHGAIDSYFRQIVYLHCSRNYKKETVLKLFEEAITDYGAPSRIRTDKRGETTLIWELMTEIRRNGGGIFLASSSVMERSLECCLLCILCTCFQQWKFKLRGNSKTLT